MDDRMDAERADFEAWAAQTYSATELGMKQYDRYLVVSLQVAWGAWQAARRNPPAVERQGEAVDEDAAFFKWWHSNNYSGVYSAQQAWNARARAATKAAAPADAPLDADEVTRLRRLLNALGMDGDVTSDETVRGLLFTALGQAASKIERASSGPAIPGTGGEKGQQLLRLQMEVLKYPGIDIMNYTDDNVTALYYWAEHLVVVARTLLAEADFRADTAHPLEAKAGEEVVPATQEVLAEIFTDSERPDKMEIKFNHFGHSFTVTYEDLDEEWFRELVEAQKHGGAKAGEDA